MRRDRVREGDWEVPSGLSRAGAQTVLKFRSMRSDVEKDGKPRWASRHDDRITRVGRALRMLHIDKLAQIFSVFRGEMSFVGPKPERPLIWRTAIPANSLLHVPAQCQAGNHRLGTDTVLL